jgi:hypothetical protein
MIVAFLRLSLAERIWYYCGRMSPKLADLSRYIYGTTRLGDEGIPFADRAAIARGAIRGAFGFTRATSTEARRRGRCKYVRIRFDLLSLGRRCLARGRDDSGSAEPVVLRGGMECRRLSHTRALRADDGDDGLRRLRFQRRGACRPEKHQAPGETSELSQG